MSCYNPDKHEAEHDPITVHLRDLVSGDTLAYKTCNIKGTGTWIWDEGNYACDCNRSLFLWNHDDEKELDCNTKDNRIVIDKIEWDKDG